MRKRIQKNYLWRRQTRKERIYKTILKRVQKNYSTMCWRIIKENNEMKSAEVDVPHSSKIR